MENILLKFLDISLALGISIYVIKLFTAKLNDWDNYIKQLVANFLETTKKFIKSQEQMIGQLDDMNTTMQELKEEIKTMSDKLFEIEQNTKQWNIGETD